MNKSTKIFVSPSEEGWRVKKVGSKRADSIFDLQSEAIARAIDFSKNQNAELCVQGLNGRIRIKNSYGNDSFPPKG